jgi:Transglycosylase SLT domain
MRRRPLAIAIVAAALYAGVLVATASAQLHRVLVTLVTGQQLTMTIDVPPGTPVSSISIPGLPAPVKSIQDLGAIVTATPTATATPAPTRTATPAPTRTATPTPQRRSKTTSPRRSGNSTSGKGTTTGGRAKGSAPGSNVASGVGAVKQAAGKAKSKVAARTRTPVPANGAPTPANPTFSLATPGPAKIGVPNFFIEKFRVPPFLLPIYQAAGTEYGVRWEVLAAINEIESDYGRNLNVSSAGAVGWMQFLPSTWKQYAVDANGDGIRDPFNPADAIFTAARYLRAAGAATNLRGAIFAYNHANWYVDSVLLRAQLLGGLPSNLVGSLTGLTEGRFPIDAKATYVDELKTANWKRKRHGNPAVVVSGTSHRTGIKIFSHVGAPVVAVQDAKVVRIGRNPRLGRFIQIQDAYGNTYTYGRLGSVARHFATAKPQPVNSRQLENELKPPPQDPKPTGPASDTTRPAAKAPAKKLARKAAPTPRTKAPAATKERLFAHPERPAAAQAGGLQQQFQRTGRVDGVRLSIPNLGLKRKDVLLKRLRVGSQVPGGTVLGRVGRPVVHRAPYMLFEIRPAGRGAPRIDPKPILDGWQLLESTAIYRAKGKNPFVGPDAQTPTIGQILLMDKDTLAQRVLADPRIQIYPCGRQDIEAGKIDRRVLATLEFLVASGFDPTVTALECGHSYLTASGNVSEHSTGDAVDIGAVNGIPILGHQGKGSITDLVIQRLLTLQGTMKPHQIISLMTFPGTDNTLALPDHYNHIHVGFRPLYGSNSKLAKQVNAILKPKQWIKLINRLGQIANPTVPVSPSKYALKVPRPPGARSGD